MYSFYLERTDPAKNMNRFYRVVITQTLFGEWALIREWGRIGSPGTVKEDWFETMELAVQAALRLSGQKQRRGYHAESG
jgi:predicted DNA-binding WGR domain protein